MSVTTAMIVNWNARISALLPCLLFAGLAAMASWALSAPSARAQASTAPITVLVVPSGETCMKR